MTSCAPESIRGCWWRCRQRLTITPKRADPADGICRSTNAGDIGLEFSSGTEGEHIGAKPNIARGQCQHVPSLCPIGDEARIIPERSKRATPSVPTSIPRVSPIGFPSSSTVTAARPDGPGCMTRFTSPPRKRNDDLLDALLEFDVLTVGVPVALQCDGTPFASLSTDVGLVGDADVGRLPRLRERRCQFAHRR
jgi:hypothetical protein